MEQRAKKYDELDKYELVLTNASLERRIEAMARELEQIALALKLCVHVDATYYDWNGEPRSNVAVYLLGKGDNVTEREPKGVGDLRGIIDEAKAKDAEMTQKDEGTD